MIKCLNLKSEALPFLCLVPFSSTLYNHCSLYFTINNIHHILSHIGPGVRVQMLVSTWLLGEILPKWAESL